MTDSERSQIMVMRNRGVGYRQIAAALDLSPNTVKAFLRRVQSIEPAADEAVCKHCGILFKKKIRQTHQIFCSPKCRLAWWNEHPDEHKRNAFYHFTCRHCGKEFESYGAPERKYCSERCYHESRRKEN